MLGHRLDSLGQITVACARPIPRKNKTNQNQEFQLPTIVVFLGDGASQYPVQLKEVALQMSLLNVKDRLIRHYTGISERSMLYMRKTFRETGDFQHQLSRGCPSERLALPRKL